MTFRFVGLVPVIALLAVGTAHAQSNPVTPGRGPSDVGNMAYPSPLPQGSVTTTTPVTPRDTGNMALPAGTSGPATVPFRRRPRPAATATAPAAAMAAPAPTADGMAAAKALDAAPGSAPVPYVDFSQPAPMKGKAMMHPKMKPMVHKAAMKKPAAAPAAAAPAAAPTAPAPAK